MPLRKAAVPQSFSSKQHDEHQLTVDLSAMTRPLKKKNGVVAGMARSGGVRQSPIGPNVADGEGQVRQVPSPTFHFSPRTVNDNLFPLDSLAILHASLFRDAHYCRYPETRRQDWFEAGG